MKRHLAVCIAGVALVAAACSSSGGSKSSTGSAGNSNPPATSNGTASQGGSGAVKIGRFSFPGGKVSGSPVKLGLIQTADRTPEIGPAAQAAVRYVNAELGGISGHPLQLVTCDEQLSPSVSASCTQQFIQAGVVGVTGFPLVWDSVQINAIEQAGLPDVSTAASGEPAYDCTVCHTLGAGYPTSNGAEIPWLKEQGAKSAAIVTVNVPGGINAGKFVSGLLTKAGIAVTSNTSHANAAPDVTTGIIKAVAKKPQYIILIDGPQDCGREVVAAAQAGFTGKLLLTPNCATTGVVNSMGAAAKQTVYTAFTLGYDSSNPEVAAYRTAMKKYSGGTIDFTSLQGFVGVMTIAEALDNIHGTPTHTSLNNYLNNTAVVPVWAGYALVKANVPPDPAFKSYQNSFGRVFEWDGNKFVDQGKWYSGWFTADPSTGASSS